MKIKEFIVDFIAKLIQSIVIFFIFGIVFIPRLFNITDTPLPLLIFLGILQATLFSTVGIKIAFYIEEKKDKYIENKIKNEKIEE